MADILQQFKSMIPVPNAGQISTLLLWVIIIVIVVAIFGLATYFYIMKKKYKYKITLFEKVGNKYVYTKTDHACDFLVSTGGEQIFLTRKGKKFLPKPTLQMRPLEYWFAVRSDGEWINIQLEDLDEKSRKLGVAFVDFDMRYSRVSIQKAITEKFKKLTFWEKYGSIITSIMHVVITSIMIIIVMYKFEDVADKLAQTVSAVNQLLENAVMASTGTGLKTGIFIPFLFGKRWLGGGKDGNK